MKVKTTEDFASVETKALLTMADFLRDEGYNVMTFYNMEGNFTLSVDLKDEDGEDTNMIAVFERF